MTTVGVKGLNDNSTYDT